MYSTVNCPGCSVAIRVPNAKLGTVGKCPKCKQRIALQQTAASPVPESSSEPDPTAFEDLTNGEPLPRRTTDRAESSVGKAAVFAAKATGTFASRFLSVFLGVLAANIVTAILLALYVSYQVGQISKAFEESLSKQKNGAEVVGQLGKIQPFPIANDDEGKTKEKDVKYAIATKEAVTINGLKLNIRSVEVGKPLVKSSSSDNSVKLDKTLLMIEYELSTNDPKKKIDHYTLRVSDGIRDNNGNVYHQQVSGFGFQYVGEHDGTSITSNNSAKGLIVFEKPLESAEHLILAIPAISSPNEVFRFKVPSSLWKK